jgi:hypothetical protein
LLEGNTALELGIFQVLDGGEVLVDQCGVGQRPQVLSGLQFWEVDPLCQAATLRARRPAAQRLGGRWGMRLPGREKLGSVVGDLLTPERMDDTHPQVRKSAQRDTRTLALAPLASVLG